MAINKKQVGVIVAGVAAVAIIGGGVVWPRSTPATRPRPRTRHPAAPRSRCRRRRSSTSRRRTSTTGPRIDPVPEAVDALEESGFEPIEAGKLTVAVVAFVPPLGVLAVRRRRHRHRHRARLRLAHRRRPRPRVQPEVAVNWADWPLGIQSGKYDLIASNVTVTEERKELYDFASYRQDLLGFYVQADSDIDVDRRGRRHLGPEDHRRLRHQPGEDPARAGTRSSRRPATRRPSSCTTTTRRRDLALSVRSRRRDVRPERHRRVPRRDDR